MFLSRPLSLIKRIRLRFVRWMAGGWTTHSSVPYSAIDWTESFRIGSINSNRRHGSSVLKDTVIRMHDSSSSLSSIVGQINCIRNLSNWMKYFRFHQMHDSMAGECIIHPFVSSSVIGSFTSLAVHGRQFSRLILFITLSLMERNLLEFVQSLWFGCMTHSAVLSTIFGEINSISIRSELNILGFIPMHDSTAGECIIILSLPSSLIGPFMNSVSIRKCAWPRYVPLLCYWLNVFF